MCDTHARGARRRARRRATPRATSTRAMSRAFDLGALARALPRKTSACVNLLLAVANMRENDLETYAKNVDAAIEAYGDRAIVSMKFNTLRGRGLTLLTEAVRCRKVEFVRLLLTRYDADPTTAALARDGCALSSALESREGFEVLINGGVEAWLGAESLEGYVERKRPDLRDALRARRAEQLAAVRGRRLMEVEEKSVSISREESVSQSTIPYDAHVATTEVALPLTSEETGNSETTSTRGDEAEATSSARKEEVTLAEIRRIKESLAEMELRILQIEREEMNAHELRRIEGELVALIDELDALFEGQQAPKIVSTYRRGAIQSILQLLEQVDKLFRVVGGDEAPDEARDTESSSTRDTDSSAEYNM